MVMEIKKTLLCHWKNKPVYEETATRKTLIEILKHNAGMLRELTEEKTRLEDIAEWGKTKEERPLCKVDKNYKFTLASARAFGRTITSHLMP